MLGLQVRLSRDKKHKAQWLRKWAQQEGVAQLSIDEAEQLVLADALPPALAELWARKAGEQRMVGALLAACSRGDLAALRVRAPRRPASPVSETGATFPRSGSCVAAGRRCGTACLLPCGS